MTHIPVKALLVFLLVASCGGGTGPRAAIDSFATGNRAIVVGVGQDELLKLRSGPGLGYNVILGLPDGTKLIRRTCVTEIGQLWCKVSLAKAPAVDGYVSADYLSEP